MTLTERDILNDVHDPTNKNLKVAEDLITLNAQVKASGAVTTTTNGADQTVPHQTVKGVRLFVDVTANAGTSETLDITLESKDPESGKYFVMPGAVFAQITGVTTDELIIYPGIAESANVSVSNVINRVWRLVFTIGGTGGPTFTFSVGAEYIL